VVYHIEPCSWSVFLFLLGAYAQIVPTRCRPVTSFLNSQALPLKPANHATRSVGDLVLVSAWRTLCRRRKDSGRERATKVGQLKTFRRHHTQMKAALRNYQYLRTGSFSGLAHSAAATKSVAFAYLSDNIKSAVKLVCIQKASIWYFQVSAKCQQSVF
jgi:hypothetical protein